MSPPEDCTPITKILPQEYIDEVKNGNDPNYNPPSTQNDQIYQPQQKLSTNQHDNDKILSDAFINDLNDDIDNNIYEKVKGYLKIIVIIAIIFVFVTSTPFVTFIKTSFPTFGLIGDNGLPTLGGTLIQGSLIGGIYLLIHYLLSYTTMM